MAIERPQALQDTFLDHLRKHDVPVTMFLTNGIRLQGYVGRFDSYSVLLDRDRQAQLVYKHAISTILPGKPVHFGSSDQQGAAEA
jgi:host factor-I protein